MDLNNELLYNNYLLELLSNEETTKEINDNLKLNLYLTLLSLNNSNYHESIYLEEINIVEDYLRKINNLKVKIQLKRKEIEINNLLNEIKDIYNKNNYIIEKYNKEKLNISNLLESKDPKELTIIIDKLTKEKMSKLEKKPHQDILRSLISYHIFNNEYYIMDNNLYIEQPEKDNIIISLSEFYEIFEYLLNINNYPNVFQNEEINNIHKNIIENIIKIIKENTISSNEIIPIILTYISLKKVPNYEQIDTSNFNIENIKITDLYSLANTNNDIFNEKTAKWKKIYIPNSYLYKKIKQIVLKGTYYYIDNKFILENIENNINEFKVSIELNNIKLFLISNIENLLKETTYKKM